jgi:hypothetical protein
VRLFWRVKKFSLSWASERQGKNTTAEATRKKIIRCSLVDLIVIPPCPWKELIIH